MVTIIKWFMVCELKKPPSIAKCVNDVNKTINCVMLSKRWEATFNAIIQKQTHANR
jgi:hypothetical protein